jgi:hypothetical protein
MVCRSGPIVVVMVAFAVPLAAASARADVICGSAPASMNIPPGAIGLSVMDGPVAAVLKGAGETRTHSFIVHGNGWVTHSTRQDPVQAEDYCAHPLEPEGLRYGYPGAEQIKQGGLYAYYYGSSGGGPAAGGVAASSGVTSFYYQNGNGDGLNRGAAVADWLWSSAPYETVCHDGECFYRVGFSGAPSAHSSYSLYQYRNMEGINNGATPSIQGNVCSTYIAYGQFKAGQGAINNKNDYDHTVVVNALNSLWNTVNSNCENALGFWKNHFGSLSCTHATSKFPFISVDFNLCDQAADQVTDCFSTGVCDTGDNAPWLGVRDDAGSTATSISPDALGGWSGHPHGAAAPYPVWSYDSNNSVFWNSGGSVYGCWQQ